jgi:hypothetical protein
VSDYYGLANMTTDDYDACRHATALNEGQLAYLRRIVMHICGVFSGFLTLFYAFLKLFGRFLVAF